ncbi:MAG TPA: efflux RND transporter periplasmic adaptor subunit [Selenomonadales bacterium]|nr:efflux RND transporter periplasmic adaptor subunit [Selenomonadales bacterium]
MQAIRQHKRWLILILVLATGAAAGTVYYKNAAKSAVTYTTAAVERGDIQAVVSATGTISPVNSVDISSKITGLIEAVKVAENDQVKVGQVLIVLDDTRLRSQVSQAQARLSNATANYERTKRLMSIGAVSNQQMDAARMDYDVARASYDDSVSQLEDTVIKAPIDGQVIGKPIPAGQTVAPGIANPMVLMTVADMSKMQISVQVDESDIGKVKVGQKVTFTVDSYIDKTFTGKVSNVSNKASVDQNVVYYPVTVDIDSPEGLLKPTMTARVSVHVGESKDTLIVPLSAVKQDRDAQYYIQVLRGGAPQNVTVKLGLTNDDRAEVLGLNEDDQIIVPAPKGAAGGAASPMRRVMGR